MAQAPLHLSGPEPVQTVVISQQRDFDKLFDGFKHLRAISYVSSAELLLDFLNQQRFENIELLVGENIDAKRLKDDLAQREPSITERLAIEVERGALRILVPRHTVHTKLYILSGTGYVHLVVTSANLTQTARRATGQTNYAWYLDVPPGHPMAERVQQDFQAQCKNAVVFMGDLLDLFRKSPEIPRDQVVSVWLGTAAQSTGDAEAIAVVREVMAEAFSHPGEEEQPVIHIAMPSAQDARRQTQKMLAPLGVDPKSREIAVSPERVVRYVEESHGVPLMRVDTDRQELWQMTERRRRYGVVNKRGPAYLYIYGPAQNGKTTFVRYILKLITGSLIEPLPAGRFTKAHVRGVEAIGTCFPLIFDDLTSTTSSTFEDIAKSHWETSWTGGSGFSQLIFTSNRMNLRDWAKSRMKRIDFDVQFVPTNKTQERLASILEKDNPIFGWFARLYLERIQTPDWLQDDELAVARQVVQGLYFHAGRALPPYFPARPLDELYDPDLRVWNDLIRRKQVTIRRERDRTSVVFADDLQHPEIREYEAALPQMVKYRRRGKTLVIENPAHFHPWLDGDSRNRRWWHRLVPGR